MRRDYVGIILNAQKMDLELNKLSFCLRLDLTNSPFPKRSSFLP